MKHHKIIYAVLLSLIFLDLAVSILGFFYPDIWNSFFHGTLYADSQALLKRCAANWFAFFILQAIALFRWEKATWWLILIAGCRLGDCLTDVTCLTFSSSITIYGIIAFSMAGLGNIIIGIYFINRYLKINQLAQH